MISVEISKSRPRNLVFLTNNYFKHKEECFICLLNTEKFTEKQSTATSRCLESRLKTLSSVGSCLGEFQTKSSPNVIIMLLTKDHTGIYLHVCPASVMHKMPYKIHMK